MENYINQNSHLNMVNNKDKLSTTKFTSVKNGENAQYFWQKSIQ
jgi:hypothetical protein